MLKDKNENLEKNDLLFEKVNCVMNHMNIFNEKETYLSYTCNTCPGRPENICYLCYEKCHKNHNTSTKNINEKKLNIKQNPCQCAINDHKVEKRDNPLGQIRTDNQELQCTMNEIFHYSDVQYYYMDPTSHMYYCLYCLESCLGIFKESIEDPLQEYIKRDKTKFAKPPLCSCSNKDCHSPFYENINCIINLISSETFDKFINRIQIPGQILSKLEKMYLDNVKIIHEEISENYKNNNFIKYKKENLPKAYLHSLKLIKCFSESYGNDTHFISNQNFQNLFNFDLLNLLFSHFEDVNLIETKINCLYFFRKLYILPILKFKEFFHIFSDFDNVSPLHRIFFKKSIGEFFELIKIDINLFVKFLNKIHNFIFKSIDRLEEKYISQLIVEYMKWLNLIVSFRFDENEFSGAKLFYFEIIQRFLQIIEILNSKKSLENLIKKYIEYFVLKIMLNNNDEIFGGNVLVNFRKQNIQNENYISNRQMTYNSNNPLINNKSKLLFSQSYVELDEEEEDEIENFKNDNQNNLINENFDKFIYEKNELNLKLIQSLFIFEKEEIDTSNVIQNCEIYDMLINKEDFYLENVSNIFNSKIDEFFSPDNEKYLSIFTAKLDKELNNIFKENDLKLFNSIKISLEDLEENKIRYYNSFINEIILYDSIMKIFSEIKLYLEGLKLLNENLNLEEKSECDPTNIFYKQLYLFKIGFFESLLNLWFIFNSNKRLEISLTKEKINHINTDIISCLKYILENNSFLISLMFNQNILSYFFNSNSNQILILEFYLKLLKDLNKQNYKINLLKFAKIISKDLEGLNDKYYKYIQSNINMTEEKFTEFILIIKCYQKILQISSGKQKGKINNIIATKLKSLITIDNDEEPSIFFDIFDQFKNEIILDKNKIILSKNKNLNRTFILSIFKTINSLEDSYFNLLSDYINKEDIIDFLNLFNELDPISRRIFTKTYSRLIVICPFKILKNVSSFDLQNMTQNIDINLTGDFKIESNIIKQEENFNNDNNTEKIIKEIENNLQNINKNLLTTADNINQNSIELLNPIIKNMEKYKRIIKKFLNSHFKNNNKFFLNFFKDTILIPSIFSIYKILYFSARIPAKIKYLTYKIVYLFFECLKHFLQLLLNDTMNLIITEENEQNLNEFFKTDQINIKEFLYNLQDDLNGELNIFNQQHFEPLKLDYIMERFVKFVTKFKIIDFIIIDQDIIDKLKQQNFKLVKMSNKNQSNKKEKLIKINLKLKEFILDYSEKKKNLEENVLVDFFRKSHEDNLKFKEIKKTITLDLIYRIDLLAKKDFINQYDEDNLILFETINILFKADPNFWQNLITATIPLIKKQIYGLIRSQSIFLFQFIIIDFHKLNQNNSDKNNNSIKNFENILEFLRLLCENHNKIYQTLLTQIFIEYDDINFIDFILKIPSIILNHVEYFKDKQNILKYFKSTKTQYFNKLLTNITDFLIEIIQGSFSNNFKKISDSQDFTQYLENFYKSIDSIEKGEEYEIFLSQFIRFLNCYLDENSNQNENKLQIIKKFNPQKLLILLMYSFKKMYYLLEKDVTTISYNDLSTYNIPENAGENLSWIFLNDEEISNHHLFILSCGIFKYFKTATLWKCGEKVEKLLNNLKSFTELKCLPEKNKSQIILKREAYKFFNNVVKEVEVFYKFKENFDEIQLNKFKDLFEEDFYDFDKVKTDMKIEIQGIQKVVYLIHPDSLFLKDSDLTEFMEHAPFENFNLKLNYLLNHYNILVENLQMRKQLYKSNSPLLNYLFKLNYQSAFHYSVIFSVIVNFLILIQNTISFDKIENNNNFNNYNNYENGITTYDNKNNSNISNLIRKKQYDTFILFFSSFHLIYLFIIILNFLSFMTYKMQKFVNLRKEVSFSDKIYNFLTFFTMREISPLVWNFLTGLIATFDDRYKFLYSLQLFTIFNIFPTMQTVIYSVRIRYKQFLSAALLILIILLFFSSVSFYLFRDEFYNSDLDENLCSSLLHCFLTLLTNGIRAGNGLGFAIKSFKDQKYFSEFIFEWIFYFSVILIMLNVINGIIVDTFQALREQNNLKDEMRDNVCFICSINRSKFEVRGVNFLNHKNVEHNVMNYFYYILKVRLTDEQDLNSLDYQVLNSINEMRTDFFPVKKALSLGDA